MIFLVFLNFLPLATRCCLIMTSPDSCAFCNFTTYSLKENYNPTLNPNDCAKKINSIQYLAEVYVSTNPCGSRACTGSFGDPYGNLSQALIDQHNKSASYMFATITINLMPGDYFIFASDFPNQLDIRLFRRQLVKIVIKPQDQDIGNTPSNSNRPVIYLKTDIFRFFISGVLTIFNVIIDGSDLTLGYQKQYNQFLDQQSLICTDETVQGCKQLGLNFSSFDSQGKKTYSLFNLEASLEFYSDQFQVPQNLKDGVTNIFGVYPPIPTLNLLNVVIQNLYTGLILGSQQMIGFKGLILSNLGSSKVQIQNMFIVNVFFPDGIFATQFEDDEYRNDQTYVLVQANDQLTQEYMIDGLTINQYNNWQCGSTNPIYQSRGVYLSTLFNFNDIQTSDVNISNIFISKNIFSNNKGLVQLVFLVAQTKLNIKNLQYINNTNFALLFAGRLTNVIIQDKSKIENSIIQFQQGNEDDLKYYLLVNQQSTNIQLSDMTFRNLLSNIVYSSKTGTIFQDCLFDNIKIGTGQLFYLTAQGGGYIAIDRSTLQQINGQSFGASFLAYMMQSLNNLTITNSVITDCSNFAITSNRELNYYISMWNTKFQDIEEFAICNRNRMITMEIINVKFIRITSSATLLNGLQSVGALPRLYMNDSLFQDVQFQALIIFQTPGARLYLINNQFINVTCSKVVIQYCCAGVFFSSGGQLQNINAPAFYWASWMVSTVWNQTLTDQATTPLSYSFMKGDQQSQVILYDSILDLDSQYLFSISNCKSVVVNNISTFSQSYGSLMYFDTLPTLFLSNILLTYTPIGEVTLLNLFVFESQNVQQISLTNISIYQCKGLSIFSVESAKMFTALNLTIQDIICGTQSCFYFTNCPANILINQSIVDNVQSPKGHIFEIQFSSQIQLIQNNLSNFFTQNCFSVLYVFQAILIISETQISSMIQDNFIDSQCSLNMITLQNSDQLTITDVIIDNQRASLDGGQTPIGGIYTLLVNDITLLNIQILRSVSGKIPLLSFQEFSNLQLVNITTINSNTASQIIYIQTTLKNLLISISNILCQKNVGALSSCLYLETASNFQINNITSIDSLGSFIQIFSSNQAQINIYDLTILRAKNSRLLSSNRIFGFTGCIVKLANLKLYDVQEESFIFYIDTASIIILNTNFKLVRNVNSGLFIFNIKNSNLQINFTEFQNELNILNSSVNFLQSFSSSISLNYVLIDSFDQILFFSRQDRYKILFSYFTNNRNSSYFISDSSEIILGQCLFKMEDSQQFFSTINQQQIDIIIYQTIILNGGTGSFGQINNANKIQFSQFQILQISKSQLYNGIKLMEFVQLNILQSKFQQMSNDFGGCLHIQSSQGILNIIDSQFEGCKSDIMGGSIFIDGQVEGKIISTKFFNNLADIGGALATNLPSTSKTSLLFVNDSSFQGNRAYSFAGGIMMLNQQSEPQNCKFAGNQAISQTDIGSTAKRIAILSDQNITYLQSLSKLALQQYIQQFLEAGQNQMIVASGQLSQLVFVLQDLQGQIVNFDNHSTIQIVGLLDKEGQTLIDNGFGQAQQGLIYFPLLRITRKPNSNFKVQLKIKLAYGRIDDPKKVLFQEQLMKIDLTSRLCVKGEIYSQDQQCQPCQINTYSLADPSDSRLTSQSCFYCPLTANCIQEAIFPKPGYWIMDENSMLVLECQNQFYCKGTVDIYEKRISTTGVENQLYIEQTRNMYGKQCYEGQGGALCQECEQGYFKFTNLQLCRPCQGQKSITFVVILLMIGLLMFYSIYQSQNYMDKNVEGQEQAILIKIFLNYYQTLSLLGSVNLSWTPNILSIFDFTADFVGAKFNFVSVQCLVTNYDVEKQFYLNLIVQIAIPFAIFFFNTIYFLLSVIIAWFRKEKLRNDMKRSESNQQNLKNLFLYVIILNAVVCIHLFYPLLTSTPTKLFTCLTVGKDSFGQQTQYLQKNMHIKCWTSTFNKWFYSFGILLSIFFGLGIPFILGFYMFYYKQELKQEENSLLRKTEQDKDSEEASKVLTLRRLDTISVTKRPLNINTNRQRLIQRVQRVMTQRQMLKSVVRSMVLRSVKRSEVFTFLVDPYKSNVFYWEISILLKKFLLIVISLLTNISSNDPANQSVKYLLLNVYMILFFSLNLKYSPYYSPLFNIAENTSFMVIILTCFSGIITSVNQNVSTALFSDFVFFSTNTIYVVFMLFIFYALMNNKEDKEPHNKYIQHYVSFVLSYHKSKASNQIKTEEGLTGQASMRD